MVHTIEQTLEGKEKGGKQFASVRKSMKLSSKLRQSLRGKSDHYFMGHPDRGLHLLFAQEKFDESSGAEIFLTLLGEGWRTGGVYGSFTVSNMTNMPFCSGFHKYVPPWTLPDKTNKIHPWVKRSRK